MNELQKAGIDLSQARKELQETGLIDPNSPVARTLIDGSLQEIYDLFSEWRDKYEQVLQGNSGPTHARMLYRALRVAVWALSYDRPKVVSCLQQILRPVLREDHRLEEDLVTLRDREALAGEMDAVRKLAGLGPVPTQKCLECGSEHKVFVMYRDLCPACQKKVGVGRSPESFDFDEVEI
jgi:hypothetical protein